MSDEKWAPIPIMPGYEVSNLGRVRNCDGRLIGGSVTSSGYVEIRVLINGEEVRGWLHHLVAGTHVPRPDLVVEFVGADTTDCSASNLRWRTVGEKRESEATHRAAVRHLRQEVNSLRMEIAALSRRVDASPALTPRDAPPPAKDDDESKRIGEATLEFLRTSPRATLPEIAHATRGANTIQSRDRTRGVVNYLVASRLVVNKGTWKAPEWVVS